MAGEVIKEVNSAVLKFGVSNIRPATLEVIPGSIITGAACGVLGAGFVIINSNLGLLRKKYINSTWKKLLEAFLFSFGTTTCFFWFPFVFHDCYSTASITDPANEEIIVQYDCPNGEYSAMATMFMNTEGSAIRSIISGFEGPGGVNSTSWRLLVFGLVWYVWTIITYGVWVPAGLFLPGIIIGCAIGGCYA